MEHPEPYTPPEIERQVDAAGLGRESHYAGVINSNSDA